MRRFIVVFNSVVFLLVMLFFGNANADQAMDPVPGEPMAPDFVLPAVQGGEHRLGDYRDRVVLVYFWATWCAPCRLEMPAKEKLYQEFGSDKLQILAVHAGPGGEAMDEFLEDVPVSFPVVEDASLNLGEWGIKALPTTILVDTTGQRKFIAIGPRKWDSPEMIEFIRERL
ncbi:MULTISPECIES: TlpA disulfide reductase family protein [unclassified Thioalkalivibrio]|uniref:TlpA disulfide reductase family protein n=1 Tax=unclassified Thioalkalivibrio TaxID=2621013 RepID=UPI00037A357A|nr:MULTISPECIES: TlpA disulfide reductase family protein [unclassified Thioalkalivibrio]